MFFVFLRQYGLNKGLSRRVESFVYRLLGGINTKSLKGVNPRLRQGVFA
jgi:hypothetical protein